MGYVKEVHRSICKRKATSEIVVHETLVAQERHKLFAGEIATGQQRIDRAQSEGRPTLEQRLQTRVEVDPARGYNHSAAQVYFHRRRTGRDAPGVVHAARYSLNCDLNSRLSHAALRSDEFSPWETPFAV